MTVKRDSMGHTYPDPKAYLTAQGVNSLHTGMSPLQQREVMQREIWERERKTLLKKASNQQGESSERVLANYLAI